MSLKNDESLTSKPKDLVFILAIAGRLDAQARTTARKLYDDGNILHLYAIADSLSSSYSMYKYVFDIAIAGNADRMHESMMTPAGVAAIALETCFLVGFSYLASVFDNENDKNRFKEFVTNSWPFFRDITKGLKNGYKGWRSTLGALSTLGHFSAQYLILPVGIGLGLIAAINRFQLKRITEERKRFMQNNLNLLSTIKELTYLMPESSPYYFEQILYQTQHARTMGYVYSSIGGFIDGLYLYMGSLGLAVLAPHMLIAMMAICAFYTIGCVITRLYEENEYQLRLLTIQSQCRLTLLGKQLETVYGHLLLLEAREKKTKNDIKEINRLKNQFNRLIGDFETTRSELKKQMSRTNLSAILLGLKYGLYAYSALASIVFMVAGILTIAGVAFPPLLVVISTLMGLVFIAGFITQTLIENYYFNKAMKNDSEGGCQRLAHIKTHLTLTNEIDTSLDTLKFHDLINENVSIEPSPQYSYQEWFEVFRSLFSGFGKGQKFSDFAFTSMQETSTDGHYRNTPGMWVLAAINALCFSVVLGLRALARGLGRPPLGKCDLVSKPVSVAVAINTESPGPDGFESEEFTTDDESSAQKTTPAEKFRRTKSEPLLSNMSFFKRPPQKKTKRPAVPAIIIEKEEIVSPTTPLQLS